MERIYRSLNTFYNGKTISESELREPFLNLNSEVVPMELFPTVNGVNTQYGSSGGMYPMWHIRIEIPTLARWKI